MLKVLADIRACFVVCALGLSSLSQQSVAQTPNPAGATQQSSERDGQHDFDFLFGHWKVHNRQLVKPLSGSDKWVEFDATSIARPIWNGSANMDEFEANIPAGHIEGMSIRLYNAKSHQWSIYWASHSAGTIGFPPTVGKFNNGRGEFFDQEDYNGKNIFARYVWTVASADSCQWEQAFSEDGGKTWETNWIMVFTREK
jgi:hypothetical protein